jgi:RNA polymerase sigma-70 factor (ECF subfamily)
VSKPAGPAPQIAVKAEAMDLRALFEQHYASMWRLLRRLGVPAAQLDDAAQEVFWVLARRLSDVEPGREHPFLYGVALRIAANELRRQRSAMPLAEVGQIPELVDQCPSPEEQLADRQARRLLDDVLNRMPIDLRTVFVLFELEGLEVRQIAELEEIPIGTASSRLRRAREEFSAITKRVRAALAARGGPGS